jgi:hypothetical protein
MWLTSSVRYLLWVLFGTTPSHYSTIKFGLRKPKNPTDSGLSITNNPNIYIKMKNIKQIIKEEINDFDWIEEHEFTHKEVIQHIKDNDITEWTFGEHWDGDLDLRGTPITSLGNLKSVGGDLYLEETPITSLGNLQSVGGYLNLRGTKITSLGNLESVGGGLNLRGTKITSLGNLQSVGGYLFLNGTKITSLGNLQSVGGNLYLLRTPISETHSEEQIRQSVQVDGDIYL